MKKLSVFIFSLFLLFPATVFANGKPQPTPTPTPSPVIICIDAGHGGADTGATYGNLTEAQETLDIAIKLQTLLTNAHYNVVMTRIDNLTSTTTLSNSDRATICNNANANYLVSIHLNGSTNHAIDYTEGLYGKPAKDKAWAQKINNAMAQLSNATGTGTITNNGITNFADGVLIKANMPATLAETVFISSDAEYSLLISGETRQQQIAQVLFNGINSN